MKKFSQTMQELQVTILNQQLEKGFDLNTLQDTSVFNKIATLLKHHKDREFDQLSPLVNFFILLGEKQEITLDDLNVLEYFIQNPSFLEEHQSLFNQIINGKIDAPFVQAQYGVLKAALIQDAQQSAYFNSSILNQSINVLYTAQTLAEEKPAKVGQITDHLKNTATLISAPDKEMVEKAKANYEKSAQSLHNHPWAEKFVAATLLVVGTITSFFGLAAAVTTPVSGPVGAIGGGGLVAAGSALIKGSMSLFKSIDQNREKINDSANKLAGEVAAAPALGS